MSKRILAIDPGTTTGLCRHDLYDVVPNDLSYGFQRTELGPDPHHKLLYNTLCTWRPDIVVCERFDYRIVKSKDTEMPGVILDSVEYIGVVKFWHQERALSSVPPKLVMQGPDVSNAKKNALWSDDKLKALGLYQAPSGRQHMNDATRHMLHYIVTNLKRTDYLAGLKP